MQAAFTCNVKKGQLYKSSNKEPHVDFQVKADWVLRLFSGGKISYEVARMHIVRQVVRARVLIGDLDFVQEKWEKEQEHKERMQIMAKIAKKAKPFRVEEQVQAWSKQFDEGNLNDRYKFLVLVGPSEMGKTRFVQATCVKQMEEALILDCSDAVVPPLKGNFRRAIHKLVMFDEAHAEMIIRVKKLFQSSINPCTYGSSPTNAFVHTVWLHGVKLVVGTNVWDAELQSLKEEDRKWLQHNAFVIHVTKPLYV